MKTIVIYQRVSTQDQDYQSQIDDLKKWAKENDFKVVASFGEKVSGYDPDAEQIEYKKMKEYVFQHNIKNVAIWEISRLSRSMSKIKKELDEFTSHSVNIYFKKENVNSLSNNTMDKFVINILGSMAEMESDTIRERTERGRISGVKRGKIFSTYPYGFTTNKDGIIAIEEKEADVVKMIYDLAIKGTSLYAIARHLNSLEIPTRLKLQGRTIKYENGTESSALWTPPIIAKILKRELYKGIRTYRGVSYPVPPIISDEIWERVQQRFRDNVGYLNNTKHDYLFKSKMRCVKCKRMIITHLYGRDKRSYYECGGHKKMTNTCEYSSLMISTEIADKFLYDALFNYAYLKEIIERETSQTLQKDNKLQQIENYKKEVIDLEGKIRRHKKLYTDGFESYTEFLKETNSIKVQIKKTNDALNLLTNEMETIDKVNVDEIIKTYKTTDNYGLKREFVNKYVNNILMHRIEAANVTWKNPLHKNEKMVYFEIFAFGYMIPIKVLITPFSKNVIVSKNLQYLKDYDMVVDINQPIK